MDESFDQEAQRDLDLAAHSLDDYSVEEIEYALVNRVTKLHLALAALLDLLVDRLADRFYPEDEEGEGESRELTL